MSPSPPRPALALVVVTQSLLGAMFLSGVGVIALLPSFSATLATDYPEYAALRAPLLAVTIALTVLALLALALVALLVQRIRRGTMLTRSSLLWVDGIVTLLACALVLVIVGVVAIGRGQAGSPFVALSSVAAMIALGALACITLVLRSLLRHAILMRTELDEVV